MNRRRFMLGCASFPLLAGLSAPAARAQPTSLSRVRPGEPGWPSQDAWHELNRAVGGRLSQVRSALGPCGTDPDSPLCQTLFRDLKNPYFIRDHAALTQTCGWADAWTAQPSAYAVSAETTADIVAAVNFAREHNLRLVVRGTGHSYLGTSNAPDSLMIWTRRMNAITVHDAFVPQGCGGAEPLPAVTIGPGAIWLEAYDEVTSRRGRYVQGGGCCTVGVGGFLQGGGFGSFSKRFGTAASNLLEAEIVTADGTVRLVNACNEPDLFWALKGGGGGTFGVLTRATLRTHDLPETFGLIVATVQAASPEAFRRLIGHVLAFSSERLGDDHWGDEISFAPNNRLEIRMTFVGHDRSQIEAIWHDFFDRVAAAPGDFSMRQQPQILASPMRHAWDFAFLKAHAPGMIITDDRTGAPAGNFFWAANLAEAGWFLHAYQSLWLPKALLAEGRRDALAGALFAASRHRPVHLHYQKGLAGGSAAALERSRDTPMNPAVLDAFALAIIGAAGPPAFPGLVGHEPNLALARRDADAVAKAADEIRRVAPASGSYVAETNYFEPDWQSSHWGEHYARLQQVKKAYDPEGLFYVHHGVGSEDWSHDGFSRVTTR